MHSIEQESNASARHILFLDSFCYGLNVLWAFKQHTLLLLSKLWQSLIFLLREGRHHSGFTRSVAEILRHPELDRLITSFRFGPVCGVFIITFVSKRILFDNLMGIERL